MAGKNTSVFGIYHDRLEFHEAFEALRKAGFRTADVSALLQENQGTKDFAHEKSTKGPEGAVLGGILGVIIGGVLGWLAGIGTVTIPNLYQITSAGPVVAALAGVGAVAILGALVGGLIGLGIPEYEAKRYEGRVKQGGALVSVHCDNGDWVKRAKQLLKETGAEDIGSAGESSADFSVSDRPKERVIKTTPIEPVSGPVEPVATPNDVIYEETKPYSRP